VDDSFDIQGISSGVIVAGSNIAVVCKCYKWFTAEGNEASRAPLSFWPNQTPSSAAT
jgi:hypothetical protein